MVLEKLKDWLIGSGLIPVDKKDFNTDYIDYTKKSMTLISERGEVISVYIGGTREIRQPVSLYYRVMLSDNKSRNSAIEKLNSIGDWVNSQEVLPSLGENIKVLSIKSDSTSSLLLQDEKSATYQISLTINYEQEE